MSVVLKDTKSRDDVPRVDLSGESFTGKVTGKKFLIRFPLSMARQEKLDNILITLPYGDITTLQQQFIDIYEMSNDYPPRVADIGMKAKNASFVIDTMLKTGKEHPFMLICTLAIIYEDEDWSKWDETTAIQKIDDWRKEGYARSDFFGFAAIISAGFSANWKGNFQNISGMKAANIQKSRKD